MAINKTDLIERISNKTGSSKSETQKFVQEFIDTVESALKGGEEVQITGFGKFYVQKRDSREGINPQTKQKMTIPAS
ncbi:MAG: HU family DNA-binding protein, partial [Rubrobacteraceae bacterium]